jgi:hypothetical protein
VQGKSAEFLSLQNVFFKRLPKPHMSDLGAFLENQLESQKKTAVEMAATMMIHPTLVSGFIKDRRRSCNVETLMKMAAKISPDEAVQAKLLEAYFRDQCLPRFKDWIRVDSESKWSSIVREASGENTPEGKATRVLVENLTGLPVKIIEALGWIARFIPGRQKFRVVIQDLGNFARGEIDHPAP